MILLSVWESKKSYYENKRTSLVDHFIDRPGNGN